MKKALNDEAIFGLFLESADTFSNVNIGFLLFAFVIETCVIFEFKIKVFFPVLILAKRKL